MSLHLSHGDVAVRPLVNRDHRALQQLLLENRVWLSQWEASVPGRRILPDAKSLIRSLKRQRSEGTAIGFAMLFRGELVGQLSVSRIAYGSFCSASIGYWISERVAGNGVTPLAVALATDACFNDLALHRVEIYIRPENSPSLRVVEKLGFQYEGFRPEYLHIDGKWADHYAFYLLNHQAQPSVLARYLAGDVPPVVYP